MTSFSCRTCSISDNDIEMSKHLSSTRHKTVIYNPLEETVECENCENDNIHQLSILRYGLSDMSLLCSSCISKEEKPSTSYTLSNGTILSRASQYYKVRDLECFLCNSDKNLFVGSNSKNDTKIIVCKNCIPKVENDDFKFFSEDDSDFLGHLLGIKEFVPKSSKRRTRKTGRKRGKNQKKSKVPTKFLQEKLERRNFYLSNKAASEDIKSGKTVLAVGADSLIQDSRSQKSRSSSPKFTSRTRDKEIPNRFNAAHSKTNLRSSQDLKPNSSSNKSFSAESFHKTKGNTKIDQNGRNSANGNTRTSFKGSNKVSTNGSTTGSKIERKGESNIANSNKKKLHSVTQKKEVPTLKSELENHQSKNLTHPKSHKLKSDRFKTNSNALVATNSPKAKNGERVSNKSKLEKVSKSQQVTKREPKVPPKDKESSADSEGQFVIPNYIKRYKPSESPKLTYDSLKEYYQEMSYNLFKEETLSMATSNATYLESSTMTIEWYADAHKSQKQFNLKVALTDDVVDSLVSKKMQKFKKVPLSLNQTVFLILGDDIPWYGQIVAVDKVNAQKGRKNGLKILDAVVELFHWNYQALPTAVDIKWLKVLPASIPVSKVFVAMNRLDNPKFIKMILGKEPIKQINFRNYLKFTKDSFNDSQKVAIQSVLNNSITILQGPPGSGKTSTIYEIILQLLENLNTFPILVVAASNIAIDNIAEKLIGRHSNSIVRIVAGEKEKEYKKEHPLSSVCLHHKVYNALSLSMKETYENLRRNPKSVSQNQYKKLLTKQIELSDLFIAQARVIFTTTVVAGMNQLKSVKKLPVVIMDESTQSSEPTTLIPLCVPGVEKIVFVGDQKQLSAFSQVPNLSLSLFERVLLNGSYTQPHMLDTQYRMHPKISIFPRTKFYNNLLKDGITDEDRSMVGITKPVFMWDTEGKSPESRVKINFREDRGYTYQNFGEVEYLKKLLTTLIYEKGVSREDIGVITPYRGQRDLISSSIVKDSLINPTKDEIHIEVDRDDIYNDSKPVTIHLVSGIMIASIDAFQGREKKFLIISCVRSNKDNKIGFLSDERRLNVALTRAQYGLILVGDVNCLTKGSSLWKEYVEHLASNDCIYRGDTSTY